MKRYYDQIKEELLLEKTRAELLAKSQSADRTKSYGTTRYDRKDHVRVFNTTRNFDRIDMNALFRVSLLSVKLPVQGEHGDYEVEVFFDGILDDIQKEIKANNWKREYKCIYRAIISAINRTDIFVSCTCDDYKYTHAFQATKGRYNAGQPQITPARITNPNDSKGAGCKHIMNVLANLDWALKLATCVNNYITYIEASMEDKYQRIIFPAIYGMSYEQALKQGIIKPAEEEQPKIDTEITDSEGNDVVTDVRPESEPEPEEPEEEPV